MTASERMRALGIVQEGDSNLGEVARPSELPAEAEDARRVVVNLAKGMEPIPVPAYRGIGKQWSYPGVGA